MDTTHLIFIQNLRNLFPLLFDAQQRITLEDLSESKSALEDKSTDLSHSVNSMHTATHENTNVAVHEVRNTERDNTRKYVVREAVFN